MPECIIIENDLPEEKSSRLSKIYDKRVGEYVCRYTTKKGYKTDFPRVGSFEVYFKHKTIFSKLKSSLWPHPDALAGKLTAVVTNMREGKSLLDGVNIKDMSESEPEPEVTELPNPKSSFVIPKVPRKAKPKKKNPQDKPKGENVFITNPAEGYASDYSEDAEGDNYKSKNKNGKNSAVMSHNKNSDDEYEEDYENEFEDDNQSKQKENNSQNNYENDGFEKDKKHYKSYKKGNSGLEENKTKNDKSAVNLSGGMQRSQNRVSSIKKPSVGSKFNNRVFTSNQATNPRKKIINQVPSRYNNLNKSSTVERRGRPNTQGKNRSQLNLSYNVTSSTNLKSNNISLSKNKLSGSKSRRDYSEKKTASKVTKEQEILITKTYDLVLNIGKKSNHK